MLLLSITLQQRWWLPFRVLRSVCQFLIEIYHRHHELIVVFCSFWSLTFICHCLRVPCLCLICLLEVYSCLDMLSLLNQSTLTRCSFPQPSKARVHQEAQRRLNFFGGSPASFWTKVMACWLNRLDPIWTFDFPDGNFGSDPFYDFYSWFQS